MTGSVLVGVAVAACVLAFVVAFVLMQSVSPCDGGSGGFPVLLLIAAVVGSSALPIATAVSGTGRVFDVVAAVVAAGVGIPAVVSGAGWVAGELRWRRVWRGVR